MPRDVATRWNSTYDMLVFAIEYHKALDVITSERDMELRLYEMSKEEWKIATKLCEVLKVCYCNFCYTMRLLLSDHQDLQGRYIILLSRDTQSRNGNSGHGSPRLTARNARQQ